MNKLLKRIIKRTPLHFPLHNWRNKKKNLIELEAWERGDHKGRPPHIIKQRALKNYAKEFDLKIFVETGTYHGDMVEALKTSFDKVYSIELYEKFFVQAKKRFKSEKHIELIQGDSGIEMEQVMKKIDQPTLFWLDGHYSGGRTGKGEKETPIYKELDHILNSKDIGHVIIVDDARCFGTEPDYPDIESLKGFVYAKRPNVKISVQDDSIRITPK